MKSHAKLRTIPTFESIESIQLMKSEFVITMGNAGILKLWSMDTGRLVYAQDQSQSLKPSTHTNNTSDSSSSSSGADLEPCIVQSIRVAATNTLVLTTVDESIVFVRVESDLVDKLAATNDSASHLLRPLFHAYKQFIGNHGEILDLKFVDLDEHLIAVATNSAEIKIYDINNWDCKILKGCLEYFNLTNQLVNNFN